MRAFNLSDDEIALMQQVRDLTPDDLARIVALVGLLTPEAIPLRPLLALVS